MSNGLAAAADRLRAIASELSGSGWSSLPSGARVSHGSVRPTRVVFIGWGAIARRCYGLLRERQSSVALTAVGVRAGRTADEAGREGIPRLFAPAELAAIDAEVVVEAAGRGAVGEWGYAALAAGKDLILCSTGALGDADVFAKLLEGAERAGARIIVPPGALAGLDGLAAASLLRLDAVTHTITKPSLAWQGTAAESLVQLAQLSAPTVIFEGTARDAARQFPANANAAAAVALTTIGLDRTRVRLIADPAARGNSHEINAHGEFGALTVKIENAALADNPKSSQLTALSIVRLLESRSSILVI
jgi:aspartate dehydrogenase